MDPTSLKKSLLKLPLETSLNPQIQQLWLPTLLLYPPSLGASVSLPQMESEPFTACRASTPKRLRDFLYLKQNKYANLTSTVPPFPYIHPTPQPTSQLNELIILLILFSLVFLFL